MPICLHIVYGYLRTPSIENKSLQAITIYYLAEKILPAQSTVSIPVMVYTQHISW